MLNMDANDRCGVQPTAARRWRAWGGGAGNTIEGYRAGVGVRCRQGWHAEWVPEIDFTQRAELVAPQLLGAVLWRGEIGLRVTEVEAYLGPDDPASHAFRGPGGRGNTMFGPPAHLYVYLSYGIHLALNLVCSPPGQASGVLLRAAEVISGLELVQQRRTLPSGRVPPTRRLASGPGNLGRALGLQLSDDGTPLGGEFTLTPATEPAEIASGPRVGIALAADWPLRFWIAGDPTVSPYRRSPRAPDLGGFGPGQ